MYVVKVGEYYIRNITYENYEIILSKELMRGFEKDRAFTIAKLINGEVIEMTEEVTNENWNY